MAQQHLDPYGVTYAIVGPARIYTSRVPGLAHAVAVAMNDWTAAEWLDRDRRLRGSLFIPIEHPHVAVEEIERIGCSDRRFVQVYASILTSRPLGNSYYWPIYEAACEYDLPVSFHFGGSGGGNRPTAAGWPSFYIEEHAGNALSFQEQVVSLVCEGVFERFAKLRIVLIEGGVAWLPPLAWRLDRAYSHFRGEVPTLKRLPSEYLRDHFWLTSQPIEEPPRANGFRDMLDGFPGLEDQLLFSSDYPHWDFDDPRYALRKARLGPDVAEKIRWQNAAQLFGLGC
jgi:hypothetical protein